MKIVHLITSTDVGGAERMLAQLVLSGDSLRSHQAVVSMAAVGLVGDELKAAGVEVYSLEMTGIGSIPAGLLRLLRILRRLKPDILQCWMYHANLLGLLAAKLINIPVIWGIRCSYLNFSCYRPLTRWVVQVGARLSSLADLIAVNSEEGRRVHAAWGYDNAKMIVVQNGFDISAFTPNPIARRSIRSELGIESERLLIGLAARFDPAKDHETFLQAAGLLCRDRPNVNFLLFGTGITPEQPALARMVRENGLEGRVHLLGSRSDVARLNAALDIGTSSSAFEGFCNAIGEAMACGVPCVVTDVGDSARIVSDTGRVVPSRNPRAIASAWAELLDMAPEARQALGQAARERIVETFRMEQTVECFESLYESLLHKDGRPFAVLRSGSEPVRSPWPPGSSQ